ncbi:MAG: hypothetical protein WCB04_06420, partial [Mycobacteriales bacterium]
ELWARWLYDRRRHPEAIAIWGRLADDAAASPFVLRNLAVGLFNVEGDAEGAMACYDRAVGLAPADARLWYERDQLAARTGVPPAARLDTLRKRPDIVAERDDLTIAVVHLLDSVGDPEHADHLLRSRRFQPWEGGEGQALAAWERTELLLARQALAADKAADAARRVMSALDPPSTLGEARHPLANPAHLWLCLGDARSALDDDAGAADAWRRCAGVEGDFREMAVQKYGEATYFSMLAHRRLGEDDAAGRLAAAVEAYAHELAISRPTIDYFATSLPQLLLFTDDGLARQAQLSELLLAQVAVVRGDRAEAIHRLDGVLTLNPAHPVATDVRHALLSGRDA